MLTIVTPTFNSEKYILRNLKSIGAQTYKASRIIVDNVSSDDTISLIKNFDSNIKIISEKDKGISDAFNKGIKASQSDIIGILNSDDEYFNEFVLERVAKAFEDPSVDFVHGDMLFVDEMHGTNVRAPLMCPLIYAMPYNHPTMFFRKRVYEQIGFFDLSYRYAMDFELICRMYSDPVNCKYKGVYLGGDPLVKMHAGGISWNQELKSIDDVERALKNHGFWNLDAAKNLALRRSRIKLKNGLSKIGLDFVIKLWRKWKWS